MKDYIKKLRACPFCGSDHSNHMTWFDKTPDLYVLSHYCHAEQPLSVVIAVYGDTPEACVERWNADGKEHIAE